MKQPQYPTLQLAADEASRSAQNSFIRLNVLQLALLTGVALVAGVNLSGVLPQRFCAWTIFFLMGAALFASVALKVGHFDDKWFRCRAFAENYKSSVWQFVMAQDSVSASQLFVEQLNSLTTRLPDLVNEISKHSKAGNFITSWMSETQVLSIQEKNAIYRKLRIEDQITWYSKKAKQNARMESFWLWTIILVEFGAVLCALIQALMLLKFNPTGGIAALSSAFIAWTQIKRFSDLDTSYSIAAVDLRKLAEFSIPTIDEQSTEELVREVEKAVSREHSMWLTRRLDIP